MYHYLFGIPMSDVGKSSHQHPPEVLEKTGSWSQALGLFQPKEADLISPLESEKVG